MLKKIYFICLVVGLSSAAQGASAFSVKATAKIDAKGNKPDAVLCRKAPHQRHTENQTVNTKKICEDHGTCTTVKANARTVLVGRQVGAYDVCSKYIKTNEPCSLDCD